MRRSHKQDSQNDDQVEPDRTADSDPPLGDLPVDDPSVWDIEEVSEEQIRADEETFSQSERRMAELENEVDELRDKYQRSLADFQNYQRRSLQNERAERQQGVRDVLQSLLGVLDHFELALAQDIESVTAEQIVSGVSAIKAELLRVLQSHGVGLVAPEAGDEFDPNKHEAVLNQVVEGIDPGRVALLLQAGYTIKDKVVRPAKVAVTPPDAPDESEETIED